MQMEHPNLDFDLLRSVDLYEASRDERHIIHIMLPGKRKQRTFSAQHERLLENS